MVKYPQSLVSISSRTWSGPLSFLRFSPSSPPCSLPSISPTSSLFFPFLPSPLSYLSSHNLPSLIPKIQLVWESCKLPQRGPRRSFGRKRICMYFRFGNRRWWWRFSVVFKWDKCLQIIIGLQYAYIKHGIRVQYAVVTLHSRIWASPTPSQNLVGSTNGMDPTYRPRKWSCPDTRSGWKSTLLPQCTLVFVSSKTVRDTAMCFWNVVQDSERYLSPYKVLSHLHRKCQHGGVETGSTF